MHVTGEKEGVCRKRIGILNLQQVDNFGCVLGAYAIQNAIRRISLCDAESIDYRPDMNTYSCAGKIKNALLRLRIYGFTGLCNRYKGILQTRHVMRSGSWSSEKQSAARAEKFESFRKRFLVRSPQQYLEIKGESAPHHDVYLVGSDVVWLLDDIWRGNSPAFLAFTAGMECRRVSYAASLGDTPSKCYEREAVRRLYREGLSHFDMVSVREETSAKYLADLYPGEIHCCMDPSLLLDASDYEGIAQEAAVSSHNGYIYVYMMNDTGSLYETINRISHATGLPIVRCCDQIDGYENVLEEAEGDGPSEFLYRIKNAELVITNSFHGVCFSLLYHKKFYSVRRTVQAYKTEELLNKLDLSDRYLNPACNENGLFASIDYEKVDEKLSAWRKESLDYLKAALE